MERYIFGRHFVDGEATLEELRKGIDSIRTAMDISKTRNYGLNFGLKLAVKGDRDLHERVKGEIPADLSRIYETNPKGPGANLRQVLLNPLFDGGIVVNYDLDACVVDTEEGLERMKGLVDRTEKDNALFGMGSKDIPAKLARYERNNNLRIIHELFYSLAAGKDRLRVIGEALEGVTPAYAELGEIASGSYATNHTHTTYPMLNAAVSKAAQEANLNGFAADYYITIQAASLGSIARCYIKAKENKFYTEKTEEEEFEDVKGLILGQTRELKNAGLFWQLFHSLNNEENIERISKFYPREQVEFVRNLMLGSLGED